MASNGTSSSSVSIGYASYQQQYLGSGDYAPNDVASMVLFFSIIVLLVVSFAFYFWFTEWYKIAPQQRHEEGLERQKEVDLLVDNIKDQVKAAFKLPILSLAMIFYHGAFFAPAYPPLLLHHHHHQPSPISKSPSYYYPAGSPTQMLQMSSPLPWHASKPPQQPSPPHLASLATYLAPPPPAATATRTTIVSREQHNVWAHRFHHAFSLAFLVGILVAVIMLLVAVGQPAVPSTSATLQAALFLLVLCINLFLITRQRFYYRQRKQLFGDDDAHMNAIYKTHFDDWDHTLANWIQLAILVIEFFQLLTFPLRDLITVNSFASSASTASSSSSSSSSFSRFMSLLLNAGGLMPDMRTPVWYTYTLWSTFIVTAISLLVAILVHGLNTWQPYKVPNRWVRWCLPVATLLYIPVLTTFVSSAACQSLNVATNDYAPTLRCHADNISQQLYLWMSLIGYVIAYFLMTMFLTSYERIPLRNEIAFKSISVAFIKNMGLLLAIVFLLVESTTNKNRLRAILSIIILLTMICYNIKTRPCYVDKVNFFRTASFSCILWTSVLVAILSDTNAAQNLSPLTVICVIVGGWILIILLFIALYCIYYRTSTKASTASTHGDSSSTSSSSSASIDCT
ncbi:hypothetical protein BC940DRAFT_289521 [Gongronella butleri]|nr:hypothetical protein BC940DRAFT_289521 [Gongronella butleri]